MAECASCAVREADPTDLLPLPVQLGLLLGLVTEASESPSLPALTHLDTILEGTPEGDGGKGGREKAA